MRDYVEGDSLRKVHWRTTARRGRLMVKELEDSPREDVVVVLDAWRGCAAPTFDIAVRAAGSMLQAHVRHGRRAALVLGGAAVEVQRVQAEGDWRRALELLAGAEADGAGSAAGLLAGERNPAALALDLVVVTPRLDAPLVERLVQRAKARGGTRRSSTSTGREAASRRCFGSRAPASPWPSSARETISGASLSAPALEEAAHA